MITLFLAAVALPPQGPPGFVTVTLPSHSQPGSPYAVKHLSPADLDEDKVVDFVHQTPGEVQCAIGASVHDAPVFAPLSSGAVTGYPGSPGLYAVNGTGLVYADHSGMPWTWGQTVVLDGDWRHAVSLEVFDVNGVGQPDLLGVTADRQGILLATDSGAGVQGSTAEIATTIGFIDDVIAYRYSPTRPAMIVASTSYGLEYFFATGTPITSTHEPDADGRLAVLRETGLPDRFAWLRDEGNGRQLEVFSLPTTPDSTLMLEAWAQSMASGTYDDDQHSDLIIGGGEMVAGERPVKVKLLRQTNNRTFSTASGFMTHGVFAAAGGTLEYEPFLGDADGDGDGDIVVAAPDGTLYMAFNSDISLADVAPDVLKTGAQGTLEHLWLTLSGQGTSTPYELNIRLNATQGPPTIVKDGATIDATHIEWFVWDCQFDDGSGSTKFETHPDPISQGYFDVTDPSPDAMTHPLLNEPFYRITDTIFNSSSIDTDLRYITLRYAAFDATGDCLARWPARQFCLYGPAASDAANYVGGLRYVDHSSTDSLWTEDPATTPASSTTASTGTGGSTSSGSGASGGFGNGSPPPPADGPG